jgi:hypothetical protein
MVAQSAAPRYLRTILGMRWTITLGMIRRRGTKLDEQYNYVIYKLLYIGSGFIWTVYHQQGHAGDGHAEMAMHLPQEPHGSWRPRARR